jgi:hypothetical protein
MATYSATIQLSGGTLTVTRPHPSVEAVDDLVDSLLYNVRDDDNPVTSVGITIVTDETAPADAPDPAQLTTDDAGGHAASDTPIGDATSTATRG